MEYVNFILYNTFIANSVTEVAAFYAENGAANASVLHLDLVQKIVDYFETDIKSKILQESYTYDFALVGEGQMPYFIEVNSFSKEYAAGSVLFHWLLDEDILYSHGDIVHFRYTVRNSYQVVFFQILLG
jgi:hypothetical protein